MRNPFRLFADVAAVLRNTERIMTAQDDEKAALAGLTAAVTAENVQLDALVAQLAAGAKASGMDDATVEGFVSQINGLTAGINSKLAQLAPPGAQPAPEPGPAEPPGLTGGDAPAT